MPILTIETEDGAELLRTRITKPIDAAAVIAILRAIDELPEPKRRRSDAGKPRQQKAATL